MSKGAGGTLRGANPGGRPAHRHPSRRALKCKKADADLAAPAFCNAVRLPALALLMTSSVRHGDAEGASFRR